MIECATIYKKDRNCGSNAIITQEIDVRTYKGQKDWAGNYNLQNRVYGIWEEASSDLDNAYKQKDDESGWTHNSQASCYAQRTADNRMSAFKLKNGVSFKAWFGYNLYEGGSYYRLSQNDFMSTGWAKKVAAFSYESPNEFSVQWWNIEGATTFIAMGVAAVAALVY